MFHRSLRMHFQPMTAPPSLCFRAHPFGSVSQHVSIYFSGAAAANAPNNQSLSERE